MDGLKEKMQVVMLPTEKATRLTPLKGSRLYFPEDRYINIVNRENRDGSVIPQHLYICSNREIKEDDWVIVNGLHIQKSPHPNTLDQWNKMHNRPLVIEACTDKSLTTTFRMNASLENYNTRTVSLPEPSLDFVKKYVEKQGNIKEVMVEMEEYRPKINDGWGGEAISPDIDFKVKVRPDNTIIISKVEETWDDILDRMDSEINNYGGPSGLTYNEIKWLKENYSVPQKLKKEA